MKTTRQVFIDANIFTYLLTGHPTYGRSCQKLLEKVERGYIEAFVSPLVIDEVSYVLMVQTARRTGGPQDARSIKKAMLHAWQDCLVPVYELSLIHI
jgi:predicted nucleic acid-binding protein